MKAVIAELSTQPLDKARDTVVGLTGTGLAITLEGWQSGAAIFAGVCTGLWMQTQIALAIHTKLTKKD